MLRFRTLALLSLTFVLTLACATPPPEASAESAVQGTLQSGGSLRGEGSEAGLWALWLAGSDVQLEVDGALVRFEDGAPSGELAFQHDESTATWRLQLASGLAVCRGRDLRLGEASHLLEAGTSYRFDAAGRLVSEAPR